MSDIHFMIVIITSLSNNARNSTDKTKRIPQKYILLNK